MINLTPVEIIIIVAVALLLFGSQLPRLARMMGRSVTQVRKEINTFKEDLTVTKES